MPQITQAQIDAARKEGYSDEEIVSFLANSDPKIKSALDEGYSGQEVLNHYKITPPKFSTENPAAPKSQQGEIRQRNWKDTLRDYGIPTSLSELEGVTRTGASIASGGAAGLATGSPVAGNAAASVVDELLRYINGRETGSALGFKNPVASAAEQFVTNEVGGKLLTPVFKGAGAVKNVVKEGMRPGSVVDPLKRKLGLTGAQMSDSSVLKVVEDLFAKSKKQESLISSAAKITKEAEKTGSNLAGKRVTLDEARDELSKVAQQEQINNFKISLLESDKNAQAAKNIAKINSKTVTQQGPPVASGLFDAAGNPIMKPGQTVVKTVEGPIDYTNTLNKLKQIENSFSKGNTKPDPSDPLFKKIQELYDATNAEFDNTGKLISHNPVGFESAWSDKQTMGKLAYGDPITKVDAVDSRFGEISRAIDSDIDRSVGSWANGGFDAKNYWNKAKQIVNTRYKVFSPQGEKGPSVKELMVMANDREPTLDAIVRSKERVTRFLAGGNVNTVTQSAGDKSIFANTNARAAAKGYTFLSIVEDAKDKATGLYNPNKLRASWAEYANSPAGKIVYNKQERDQLTEVFNAFAAGSGPVSERGKQYLTFRVAQAGLGVASAVVGSAFLGSSLLGYKLASGAAVGLAAISMRQLAKWSIDPKTGPLVAAAFKGGPLNMSQKLASKLMTQALKGEVITLIGADGTEEQVKINNNGEPEPVN